MHHLVIDPTAPDMAVIEEAARVLKRGGIVAYPTDTLYALGVDPRNDEAVRRLYDLKGRDQRAAVPLIAADVAQARRAGAFGPIESRLAERLWPGPLTIVVPADAGMSTLLSAERHTLGVRVPANVVARRLAEAFGGCITATSANISGRPASETADEVAAAFEGRLDALVDGGPVPGGPPSTVLEVIAGTPVLHRAGAVPWDRVLESL